MFENKSIQFKILSLLCLVATLFTLVIKFYFIPQVDQFIELSIEHDMKKNMESFEKIVHIVAKAASGDKAVIERAFKTIHSDPAVPIELRRSKAIDNDYGTSSNNSVITNDEIEVFRTGESKFLKTTKEFVYIYPLKVNKICQECHVSEDNQNKPVPLGYVLGLAIAKAPKTKLVENKLLFFVKDLFVVNATIFFAVLIFLYLILYKLVLMPLVNLKKEIKNSYLQKAPESEVEIAETLATQNEIDEIRHYINEAKKLS